MAQSKADIKAQLLSAISGSTAIAGLLSSPSSVAIWNQLADAFVSVQQTSQQLGDIQEVRMEAIAAEAVPGTPAWLERIVKKFQYGDQVQVNSDLTVTYATPDPAKQIITQCAIQENLSERQVLVKVATGASAAALAPISAQQLSSLKAYIQKVKFAGIKVVTISLPADRLYVAATIYYAGELDPAVVKTNVVAAIGTYLQSLAFDGNVYLSKLEDAIQAVAGVNDVTLDEVLGRPYTTTIPSLGLTPVARVYATQAGYIIPEDTTGYTLADSLTLIAS